MRGPTRWLWTAPPWRAAVETAVVVAGMTLNFVLLQQQFAAVIMNNVPGFLALCAGAWPALRLRAAPAPRRPGSSARGPGWLLRDLVAGCAVAIEAGLLVAVPLALGVASAMGARGPFEAFFVITVGSFLSFALFRGSSRVWLAWDAVRRRRLAWSLTGAHVAAALIVTWLGVAVFFALVLSRVNQTGLIGSADAGIIARIESYFAWAFPALILAGAGTAVAVVVVLPVSALFSFVVTRPLRSRIQRLAAATRAFVESPGRSDAEQLMPPPADDEIGQLTRDFSTMAVRLRATLSELEQERDRARMLLDSRRVLVAEVSHELRTPVAVVKGHLEAAESEWARSASPPPDLRNDLAVMRREIERLQVLLDDLFSASRADADGLRVALTAVAIAPVIDRTVQAFAPLAWRKARVQVLSEQPSEACWVLADELRLTQILANLVRNAIRHTPPGGLVLLRAISDHLDGEASWATLEVKDTGEGIDPSELPNIWDRFRSGIGGDRTAIAGGAGDTGRQAADDGETGELAEDDLGGGGLGLYVVRQLTEAMGGRVEAQSSPGEGSTFRIHLPTCEPHPVATQPRQSRDTSATSPA